MFRFFLVTGYQRTKSNRLIFWEHVLRYQVVAVGIKCSYRMAKQTNISEMVSSKSSTLDHTCVEPHICPCYKTKGTHVFFT